MQKKLLEQFADLRKREREIKEAIEALKPEVTGEIAKVLAEEGATEGSIETDFGKFSLTLKRDYNYPQYVVEAEAHYNDLKDKAKATGDATYIEKQVIRFDELK